MCVECCVKIPLIKPLKFPNGYGMFYSTVGLGRIMGVWTVWILVDDHNLDVDDHFMFPKKVLDNFVL